MTGSQSEATCKSRIQFILTGDNDESDIRSLPRMTFERGGIDSFVMTTAKSLGDLQYLRIWHDNTGIGSYASWFLGAVIVRDMQTGKKFQFANDRWLAVEYTDGEVDRTIPVVEGELPLRRRFYQTRENNLKQNHLWFSVFSRPPRSRYTRCQRVSAAFVSLYLSMLGNAMWFGTGPTKAETGFDVFGIVTITWEEIIMGVLINALTFPFVFLIVFLFKYSKPSKLRNNTIIKALQEQNAQENEEDEDEEKEDDNGDGPSQSVENDDEADTKSLVSTTSSASTASTESTESNQSLASQVTRRKFSLPFFCLFIGWFLCLSFILLSAFFLWAYAMHFGNDFINKWLISVILSFFTSFLIFEPLKVLIFVMIYSLFCHMDIDDDFDDSYEDEEAYVNEDDEEWYNNDKTLKTKVYRPYGKDFLLALKKARVKQVRSQAVANELFTYVIFLIVIFIIAYENRDADSFQIKSHIENNFILKHRFLEVRTSDDFWRWAHETLVNEVKVWINDQ